MNIKSISMTHYKAIMRMMKGYHDTFKDLHQAKIETDEEINKIYGMIENNLIKTNIFQPAQIINLYSVLFAYKNKNNSLYFKIFKKVYDEYPTAKNELLSSPFCYYLEKDYGIKANSNNGYVDKAMNELNPPLGVFRDNTIMKAIMNDDIKSCKEFTNKEKFDPNETVTNHFMVEEPDFSYLELCCYYGSVECFMYLRSKFNSEITKKCLKLSFLSGNLKIINECLLYQKPNQKCMEYAIFSYNNDLVMLLVNKYKIQIDPDICQRSNNIESLALFMEQTRDYDKIFPSASMFYSLELMKYLSPLVKNFNTQDNDGWTAVIGAIDHNRIDIMEYLISLGADVNLADNKGRTPLMIAVNLNR
ncbi:hypothetical protein TVAG_167280 [Trichomonas vaginalis G3]|uniref:DUF3447 domain-containing protein n=1 Tax=Trichomonas vaginalis (strain ATCC PRA-98 / G3) TaxID=412133 RepID=A2DED5_TRIV3|nr:nerve growth factor signaling pathway [Trichomonas vaginalis G3]EAY21353.1 hypothetical protein TVAG_167280 [Trichomonas vaginalis G3]KAI5548909.1 nerve growth factor signaling pathway [Trichomonas vaginalis G3]|eukprot:XP_001582339.1 hypothetical protein [Trichomonas vaginalis G3]